MMNRSRFSGFLVFGALAVCLAVMACTSNPQPAGKPLPLMTFDHLQPLPVSVGNVQVVGQLEPFASSDFVVSPYNETLSYLQRRFKAAGGPGVLRLIPEQAKVTYSHEKSPESVASFLDVGGYDVYNVEITVRIEHRNDFGQVLYGKAVMARRIMKITEHASMSEREQHQLAGMEALFKDLDQEVRRIVLEGGMGLQAGPY